MEPAHARGRASCTAPAQAVHATREGTAAAATRAQEGVASGAAAMREGLAAGAARAGEGVTAGAARAKEAARQAGNALALDDAAEAEARSRAAEQALQGTTAAPQAGGGGSGVE